ncbi:AT-hook motif nuclear-localized protein 10-like isoform X1 [Phragmites australis]|uniref:AT-hook motif nuclear-localized protein 10-like isoform X1 n=1 Tax=Phragmites australis TaxID=29695 RepID=UPI002D79D2C5|nr:AT-hook motif nuclear-localized protein 10-like isoform X1 [Phragmites australis]XP_062228779.1 AT-hook motif nuclear-localized protein 10-like isoform X1 [Phragmites australis]
MSAAAAGEAAAYGVGLQRGALQQHQQQPNPGAVLYMHNGVAVYRKPPVPAAYQRPAGCNAAAPEAAPAHSPTAMASAEQLKRKRGRPRKYAQDGVVPLAVVPPSQPVAVAPAPAGAGAASGATPTVPPGFSPSTEGGGVASPQALPPPPASEASSVKKRGRLLGSTNKKQQPQVAAPAGSGWAGLKPHVFTVQAGEDVASRAMSFSCNGWAVCILTANGAVSNVTLRQGDSSVGTVTYEGHFEILSLAGSYLLSESAGLSSRTGGLSVSLAGPDGRVLGGAVAGPLTAASPVQVVIGSFVADGKKEPDPISAPGKPGSSGGHGSLPNTAGSFNTGTQPGFPNFAPW